MNPEGIYYIGQTLIEINTFILTSKNILNEDKSKAIRLIDEIIKEASEDDRPEHGLFNPIFNLEKINELTEFLLTCQVLQ